MIITFYNYFISLADNYLRTNKQHINLFYTDLKFHVEVLSRTKPCLIKVVQLQYYHVTITFDIVTLADNYVRTNKQLINLFYNDVKTLINFHFVLLHRSKMSLLRSYKRYISVLYSRLT